jgi:mannonate dehydratase
MTSQPAGGAAQSQSSFEGLPMRVALGTYRPVTDEFFRLARQLGVDDVLFTPHRHPGFESAMPLGEVWTEDQITQLCGRANAHDLRVFAFEKMPVPLYEILLADPDDRPAKIEIITETIRNMGAAGVPVLGYSGHPPDGAVRTTRTHEVRGGAEVSAFDEATHDIDPIVDEPVAEEDLWDAYADFLDAVLPVAEEAGVTLAVHPSDPPIESFGGVPLLFRNFENFKRAMDMGDSENHGLKFCLGCWSEMGEDLETVIRHFGGEDIVYVHFRDVVGTVPSFHETFIDDPASNFDEYRVMKTLREEGFTGVMTPDHVPQMEGESDWEFGSVRGRSFTVGYLRGMLRAIEAAAAE